MGNIGTAQFPIQGKSDFAACLAPAVNITSMALCSNDLWSDLHIYFAFGGVLYWHNLLFMCIAHPALYPFSLIPLHHLFFICLPSYWPLFTPFSSPITRFPSVALGVLPPACAAVCAGRTEPQDHRRRRPVPPSDRSRVASPPFGRRQSSLPDSEPAARPGPTHSRHRRRLYLGEERPPRDAPPATLRNRTCIPARYNGNFVMHAAKSKAHYVVFCLLKKK